MAMNVPSIISNLTSQVVWTKKCVLGGSFGGESLANLWNRLLYPNSPFKCNSLKVKPLAGDLSFAKSQLSIWEIDFLCEV